MALPTQAEVITLNYTAFTLPFFVVDAKAGIDSASLDYTGFTLPFAALNSVGGASLNAYVLVNGAWKTVDSASVLVNGVWKDVDSFNTNVSGSWKS